MTVDATNTARQHEAARCLPPCCPGDGLSAADSERLAGLLKALADPVRLRLYSRIASADETCVCDIQDVGVSQPTVSHHLRKLREAGLIDCERRGTWVWYRAVPGALEPLSALPGLGKQPAGHPTPA